MSQPESSSIGHQRVFFETVMKGEWDKVIEIYLDDPTASMIRLTRSGYTALHVAVSYGGEDIVAQLIEALEEHAMEALEIKDEAGNTPLHIAASVGNVRMCKLIIADGHHRMLIGIKNKDGETPLFLAALHGKNDAFLCLHSFCLPDQGISYCRRDDGNSILHCAIDGEYLDLAFQIIQLYKHLVNYVNGEGLTPLHVLATKPSAFESGSNLGRFQKMVHKILSVKKLKANETYQEKTPIKNEPNPSCPQNYQTGDRSALETEGKYFFPPNYATCFNFVKVVLLIVSGAGYGGVTNILDEKRKHTWSLQVLDELLHNTDEYENAGQVPFDDYMYKHLILNVIKEDGEKTEVDDPKKTKELHPQTTTKKDSPILIAAKHGITEIVKKILEKFPVAINDTLDDKKNIVLIAVENRQSEVYKLLLKKYDLNEGVFRKVDMTRNGALHIAAQLTKEDPGWPIPGDALQMQWEIKWLKFVEKSKPKNFFVRYNIENRTPDDIFTKTHKELVKSGGKWMKSTAESCSVVAALIATVAFATSTALPGGVDDKSGKPHLETKPGFQVFAIASLIALCFSVTSLVMFLAILTSRYQQIDFGRNLPWKLLLGLTSLFVSIASMLVSFCAGHFFVLEDTIRNAAFPVYALTGVPVTFFAAAQFPLYFDLIRATFRSPF
ncbi:hypothetical protein UlMin_037369 [Ulmus minor]